MGSEAQRSKSECQEGGVPNQNRSTVFLDCVGDLLHGHHREMDLQSGNNRRHEREECQAGDWAWAGLPKQPQYARPVSNAWNDMAPDA